MAVIFPDKLIFLEHPRMASTSLRKALVKVGGEPRKRHTFLKARRSKERTVSTVRNPFDLLVSWWIVIGQRQGFKSFADFITTCIDPFMVQQERLFYFLETDYILRFESLESDVNIVLKTRGIRPIILAVENKTLDKKHYREYYDDVTRPLVMARFGAEIERFGYEWID